MQIKISSTVILLSLLLAACGGGGGGSGSTPSIVKPTVISGIVSPPLAVTNGTVTPSATIFTPPNSTGTWSAVVQSMDYTFDPAAAATNQMRATTVSVKPVDTATGSFSVTTGVASLADPATGQTTSITNIVGGIASLLSTGTGSVLSQSTFAGLPAALLVNNATASASGYVLPYSAVLNTAGYAYQTFGAWITVNPATAVFSENYFSAGAVSVPGVLPVAGTASYTGKAAGSLVVASTRDISDTVASMIATADFAARTVSFATTGTTSLSNNAPLGTLPSANSGLDLSGTLSYLAGSNTFTGAVSTVNGMNGNATGHFYGPGIIAPTANQVLGSPPEIGGTFAVMTPGVSAMQGAFGGSGSHPPTVVPVPTTMIGIVTPPVNALADVIFSPFPTIVTPPNNTSIWGSIEQGMDYTFDPVAAAAPLSTQVVTTINVRSVSTIERQLVTTGVAYPADPTLGQAISITNGMMAPMIISTLTGAVSSQTVIAGLPAVTLTNNLTKASSSYVMPLSATLNPTGYTYQTFGSWQTTNFAGALSEVYFSSGISTAQLTLPVVGTASYTGQAAGSYVNAITNDPSKTVATMNATADFAARTVAFSTTATTSLSNNAAVGTLPTANAGLNMNGTLSYAAGSNTFTGAVTTTNGMSGNATGRFYGPGIAVATPTKVVGAPPEIGGTFAVMATGVGAMQGAFGGK